MPVYILREGVSNVFKIGRTSGQVEGVISRLRTGNSQQLTRFDVVETDQESACEAFFHRRLQSKRKLQGGGWEFFEVEPDEMTDLIGQFRQMFGELADARAAIGELEKQQSSDVLREPSAEDKLLLQRLVTLKEEQEYLNFERELIEAKLKQRIGTASGVRGIATWKTQVRRNFDDRLFRESDPDRYNELLEKYYCIDTKTWSKDRPDEYEALLDTYYSPSICRALRLQKLSVEPQ